VATNGEVALAVWSDARSGVPEVRAARINRNGEVLDPLGLRLGRGGSEALLWNQEEFVVLVSDGATRTLHYINADGALVRQTDLPVPPIYRFAAGSTDGRRLLFLAYGQFGNYALVATSAGETIVSEVPLPAVEGPEMSRWVVAGNSDAGFVVLRTVWSDRLPGVLRRTITDRIDVDGRVLSSTNTNLPAAIDEFDAVAGGADGYLIVTQRWLQPDVIAYRLDANGVFTGSTETLLTAAAEDRRMFGGYRPNVVRENDRYVVGWHTSLQTGESIAYVAEVSKSTGSEVREISRWPGITSGTAIASHAGHRLAMLAVARLDVASNSDVFAQRLGQRLDADAPRLLSASATVQSEVETAVGANGYLLAWREVGPDGFSRLYLQRLSSAGVVQDERPIEARRYAEDPFYPLTRAHMFRLVSSGETYLLAWSEQSSIYARRLRARTAEWMDPEPFLVGRGAHFAIASNGLNALVVSTVGSTATCNRGGCVSTHQIALDGPPLSGDSVAVSAPGEHYDVAVASNGNDYLVAWSEGFRNCAFLCILSPFRILAVRVRADGARIDAEPLTLHDRQTFPVQPSIAWNGRYLVVWNAGGTIFGRRVTAEGSIVDDVTVIERGAQRDEVAAKVVSWRDRFLLLSRRTAFITDVNRPTVWRGVAFRSGDDLAGVASLPGVDLVAHDGDTYGSLSAAPGPAALLIAYDKVANGLLGDVPRVFFQLFTDPERRRAAR